jgi:hypothetical protein
MTEIIHPTPEEIHSLTTDDTEPTGLEIIAYAESLTTWIEEAETRALEILDCYEKWAKVDPRLQDLYVEMLSYYADAFRVPFEDSDQPGTKIVKYAPGKKRGRK